MAIIRYTKGSVTEFAYLNQFPDQFKSAKHKAGNDYMKSTMDYFSNQAYAEYQRNRNSFVKNYDLMKGILRKEDFYQEDTQEVKSFADMLEENLGLPSYVQHYSIITTPVNELVGEISKRPDTYKLKAFDDDSKSEELQFKTDILQKFIVESAKQEIMKKAAMAGEEVDPEELDQMTMEQVKDELDNYTSIAEKWGNHILTAQRAEFNMKEKSEEAFRDLLISSREYYHIYEDNSKLGFNVEVSNPKNTWSLSTQDKKYISDPTGRAKGAYAAGTLEVMELSEIIEAIPELTKQELDHLRTSIDDYGLLDARESNLTRGGVTPGNNSIEYDTYDPLEVQSRMMIEHEMDGDNDEMTDFLGTQTNTKSYGFKYVVLRSYWASKKKIGKLVYDDEMGNEQTTLVDENYKSGTIPTQKSLSWGWVNQWYKGTKVGADVYHVAPFDFLPYCPIIGTIYEVKNTNAKSLVDLMKPFQVIYNVCMNQLYKLLEKEIGNVASINIRRVPVPRDGDAADALDVWELEARERGIIFDDDSPENTKAPVSNTTIARNIDLTRTNEIQARYNLAQQMKLECWELIGMSKQRMGSVSASETATGTNTAMQQSYSQTEPLFVAHEYVLGQLYQAIVDGAQYIESSKEESTISYVNSEGASAFIKVNGSDISMRDLKVFLTNRPEDTKMFNELRQLSQAVIQNGGTLYDIVELYSTKSIREMKKTFKDLRDQQVAQQQQAQALEEKKLTQQQEQFQAGVEEARQIKAADDAREDYQADLDRLNDKEIAIIKATGFGQVGSEDADANGVPDVMELGKIESAQTKSLNDYNAKMADITSKDGIAHRKLKVEEDKNQVARENMVNDLAVAKENRKGRTDKK